MFKAKKKNEGLELPTQEISMVVTDASSTKEDRTVKETLIAKGTLLTGEISNEADVLIEGSVVGDIRSSRSIRIGKEGKVQGTLTAEKITINGYLQGKCHATAVKILSQGRLDGDIQASELSIERGGIFNGNSQYTAEPAVKAASIADKDKTVALPSVKSSAEPLNNKTKQ